MLPFILLLTSACPHRAVRLQPSTWLLRQRQRRREASMSSGKQTVAVYVC